MEKNISFAQKKHVLCFIFWKENKMHLVGQIIKLCSTNYKTTKNRFRFLIILKHHFLLGSAVDLTVTSPWSHCALNVYFPRVRLSFRRSSCKKITRTRGEPRGPAPPRPARSILNIIKGERWRNGDVGKRRKHQIRPSTIDESIIRSVPSFLRVKWGGVFPYKNCPPKDSP